MSREAHFMTALIESKKPVKEQLNPHQKTFRSLKKKIEILQGKLKKVHQELDECMRFYLTQIHPEKEALKSAMKEFVKLLYSHYKKPKAYSKSEKKVLKEVMLGKLDQVFDPTSFSTTDPEICAIIQDLDEISYDEIASNVKANLKGSMEEMCKDRGVDIDLSFIDFLDDESEIFRKVFEAMHAAHPDQDCELPKRPKTKRQKALELKEQALHELKKKGLNGIYKQLAKAIHPDLEQDVEKKAEKEQLMKRLTNAYENQDMHELLLLEMELAGRSDSDQKTEQKAESDEQLKLYNAILKKQVESLQESIKTAFLDPKYYPLEPYFAEANVPIGLLLNLESLELQNQRDAYDSFIQDLQGPNASKSIRELLYQLS